MDSGKSTLALQTAHNHQSRGRTGLIFTSQDRAGSGVISSRLGLQSPAIEVSIEMDLHKYVVDKFLENIVCNLIIKEMNDYIDKNNNWDILNMNNENIFTINLDKLPKSLNHIIENVFDLYSNTIKDKFLKEKTLNFKDIFITKYNDSSNFFNFHNSMTTITSYIFLNNTNIIMGSNNHLDANDELVAVVLFTE